MQKNKIFHRRKVHLLFLVFAAVLGLLSVRLFYLMVFRGDYYSDKAQQLHERERPIKAARGMILDRAGVVLASNEPVCTISVVHSQIEDEDEVTRTLCEILSLDEERVRKKVEKVSSMERIASNVPKETGDAVRALKMPGVKVDEDYKRTYPYGSLASRVLGFTGADNQGIVGLEVEYDEWLQGTPGTILVETDAKGVDLPDAGESRIEPMDGWNLTTSLDVNMQLYATQAAEKVLEEKQADSVSILLMNPKNGEIYAMVNVPEFDLNDPFTLPDSEENKALSGDALQDKLNGMWRNACLNDTYEPGSAFKIITASAALEQGVVTLEDSFSCGGYRVVEDRRIHCHKRTGHGAETFLQGIENSCNPVFIDVALRLGAETFYDYFKKFQLVEKTGIDLPGEAGTIMHDLKNIGQVELATMAFGQSFQITPIRLAATVCALVNGGTTVTPHIGMSMESADGSYIRVLDYEEGERIVSAEVSETMQFALEKVVSEGGGKNAYIEGYAIGGKTATSQTLPRSANRYISSFVGFAPADDPEILGICIIRNPQGVYYGGTIAAPVIKGIYESILPWLGIEKKEAEAEGNEVDKTVD